MDEHDIYPDLILYGTFLVALLFSTNTADARPPANAVPSGPQAEARTAEATHVEHAPKLDGTLVDPLWQSAKPITDFRQREHHEGEPATAKTEAPIHST